MLAQHFNTWVIVETRGWNAAATGWHGHIPQVSPKQVGYHGQIVASIHPPTRHGFLCHSPVLGTQFRNLSQRHCSLVPSLAMAFSPTEALHHRQHSSAATGRQSRAAGLPWRTRSGLASWQCLCGLLAFKGCSAATGWQSTIGPAIWKWLGRLAVAKLEWLGYHAYNWQRLPDRVTAGCGAKPGNCQCMTTGFVNTRRRAKRHWPDDDRRPDVWQRWHAATGRQHMSGFMSWQRMRLRCDVNSDSWQRWSAATGWQNKTWQANWQCLLARATTRGHATTASWKSKHAKSLT